MREVDLKSGEEWTQKKYREMNERYQRQILEQLGKLAKDDKPFFLQYWPLLPLTFTRSDVKQFHRRRHGDGVLWLVIVEVGGQ